MTLFAAASIRRRNSAYRMGAFRMGADRMGAVCRIILAVTGVSGMAAGTASAQSLVPHLAQYDMTLRSAEDGSGVTGIHGGMQYRIVESCDGWTTQNKTYMRISRGERAPSETLWQFTSWESKDGLDMHFRGRHMRNGKLQDTYKGSSSLERLGGTGTAKYLQPEKVSKDLPEGTLFPIEHLKAILSGAAEGQKIVARPLFDGSSKENPYVVNTVIYGPAKKSNAALMEKFSLPPSPAWRMRMAFFPVDSRTATANFEIEADYRADGIASRVVEDFGNFTLDLKAHKIELLPRPKCSG